MTIKNKKKKFEIGLFALNSSSGISMTKVEERWRADWDDIEVAAKLSDKAGMDFIISVQRWLGFEGATDPAGLTYDSLTFCAALASITSNIRLYATVHVPILHPTYLARSLATIDQVSKGRAALNIVCGWNQREFEMFDIMNQDMVNRYDEGEEWLKLLNNILSSSTFKPFKGNYFNTRFSTTSPKLYKRNKINTLNAAFSETGRLFAAKNCDSLITMFSSYESARKQTENIKKTAKLHNNNIKVYGLVHIVCRQSDKEAEEYYDNYAGPMADTDAINNFISILSRGDKKSVLANLQKSQMKKMAGGLGSFPIIGSPKTVLSKISDLDDLGLDGIAIGFVNFKDELPYFIDNVFNKLT